MNPPSTRGIIGFHSAFLAALGNIGIITKTSVDSASKTASLGGIRKLKNGTITMVGPKPANPLINPPAATIANKGAQYDKSRFNASKFTMSDQTNFPVGEKRLD
jgi:hypothetical protein